MAAQPYTTDDMKRGEELVQELHGLKGFNTWAEHLAKALASERARAERDRLRAALIQVRGFAAVMEPNNWRDLQLHIKRQCNVLDG